MNNKPLNTLRRDRGLSLERWRADYDTTFSRVRSDIWKNLRSKGVIYGQNKDEQDDITQIMELCFIQCFNRFMACDDRYPFPPLPGALYKTAYFDCRSFFTLSRTGPVYPNTHDEIIERRNLNPYDFYEEREERLAAEKEIRLTTQLERELGGPIELNDALGSEFALWWLGMTYDMIAANKAIMGKAMHPNTVAKRMRNAFKLIQDLTGMSPADVKACRKWALTNKSKRK